MLKKSQSRKLSSRLLQHQLILFGNVARAEEGNPLRDCVFQPNTVCPLPPCGPRGRGRPRQFWAACVYKEALRVTDGDAEKLRCLAQDGSKNTWRSAVISFLLREEADKMRS